MYTTSVSRLYAPVATGASRCIDATCLWGVLHVTPQYERRIDATLFEMGIASYLPLVRERRVYRQGGRRTIEKPLFECYVFYGYIDENQRAAAASVDGVLCRLDVHYSQQSLLVKQIQDIARFLAVNPNPRMVKLEPGDKVQVVRGPLQGVIGTLIRRHHEDFLIVGIEMLNHGAEMQISISDCERIT